MLIIYQKHLFELIPKFISKFPKTKDIENDKKLPRNQAFFSLPSNSWKFQQQLMTKSETPLDFKLLGNN